MVGYATKATTAKKYLCFSPNFVSTSGTDGKFTLRNYVPTGFNYMSDEIRIINPTTGGIITTLSYLWDSDGYGVTGWWDMSNTEDYTDTPFDIGTAFMTSYDTQTEISAQGSGQVYAEAPTIDCRNNKYQMIPNPLPRRVKFSEVTVTGFDYMKDEVRVINPTTGGISVTLSYLYDDDGYGVTGWWDMSNTEEYNDKYIEVGEGFMLSSDGKNVQITFPKAM